MSRQFWNEGLSWSTQNGSMLTNSTTETILFPNITIPANYLQDGRTLKIHADGQYTTAANQPWFSFALRWGGVAGTILAKTSPTTLPNSVTGAPWHLDAYLTTRSNGSNASVMTTGAVRLFSGIQGSVASATGEAFVAPMTVTGASVLAQPTANIDATADTALSLTGTWGTAAGADYITGHNYIIESLN